VKHCEIHPDVEMKQMIVREKKATKLGWSCEKCDQLVEELKTTKAKVEYLDERIRKRR
jgi:hypothetical protein